MGKISSRIWIVILMIAAFGAGFFTHAMNVREISKVQGIYDLETGKPIGVSFDPFWKAWNTLNSKYVDSAEISVQDKVWGAISGLADSFGDPYTVFMSPEENKMFEEDISGNFGGVGIEIGIRDEILTVITPLKGTPAEASGIRPGDKIVEINGDSTIGITTDRAVRLIRGEQGTSVSLTIIRDGSDEPLEITINRAIIEIPTIETEYLQNENIFIISLFNFNANASELFKDSLQEFVNTGSDKLILDLRNNPGGYMGAAIDISSWFLPAGRTVVIEDLGKGQKNKLHRSKGFDIFNSDLKMVVLVNEGSASASEIVAGALKDHEVATLIGAQTFGKGSVQELIPITKDTSLKVTVARWLTPEGVSISDGGLSPNIEVEMTLEDFEEDRDPQMDRAIEFLRN